MEIIIDVVLCHSSSCLQMVRINIKHLCSQNTAKATQVAQNACSAETLLKKTDYVYSIICIEFTVQGRGSGSQSPCEVRHTLRIGQTLLQQGPTSWKGGKKKIQEVVKSVIPSDCANLSAMLGPRRHATHFRKS